MRRARSSRRGIERGDRVAVWAPNSLEWIVAALGVTTAGAVLVPVNTRFRGAEAAYVLARSSARALFTVRGFLDTDYPALLADAGVALPALEHTDPARPVSPTAPSSAGTTFLARGDAVPARRRRRARRRRIGPDDPSDVVFTSGTTGNPKGVVMTHGQTLRAYLDWCDWADLRDGRPLPDREPVLPHLRLQGRLPRVAHARRDDLPARRVRPRRRARASSSASGSPCCRAPPTIYQSLLDHPDRARRDISSLRLAVTGAADIPVELIRRVREELPFERILTGYGLTEAGTVTGSRPDDDFEHIATTVGVPWPGFEVRTVDRSGRPTPRRASRVRSSCAARP